jgi:hypothetical protein
MKKIVIVNPKIGEYQDKLNNDSVDGLNTYLNDGWEIERETVIPVATGQSDYRRLGSIIYILYKPELPKVNPTIALDRKVYHKDIYNGGEQMTITGIKIDTKGQVMVELEGDYSGGTHNVCQRDWHYADGLLYEKH